MKKLTKSQFKLIVKAKIRQHVFKEQEAIKMDHSKVKDIVHLNLNDPQEYLRSSSISNRKSSLLHNLGCKSVNEFKSNFQHSDQHFPCFICRVCDDTQEHALLCKDLRRHIENAHETLDTNVQYVDLFGSVQDQLRITQAYTIIIKIQKKLRNKAYLGIIQDQLA